MSWIDGVSQCWKLSETCGVNWNAWAAIGTVAAVFTAVLGPAIQRRFFLRKKSNAILAAAFINDLVKTKTFIESLLRDFPLGDASPEGIRVQQTLEESDLARESFQLKANQAAQLAGRDLDPSKWAGADMDLLLTVAHAIRGASDVVLCGEVMTNGTPNRQWDKILKSFRSTIDIALEDISHAADCLTDVNVVPALVQRMNKNRRELTWAAIRLGAGIGKRPKQ